MMERRAHGRPASGSLALISAWAATQATVSVCLADGSLGVSCLRKSVRETEDRIHRAEILLGDISKALWADDMAASSLPKRMLNFE